MWIAVKPFSYRGTRYKAGDRVPAETWTSRRALVSMRKIKSVPDTGDNLNNGPIAEPQGWKWVRKTYEDMKRADLDAYASEQGIDKPSSFSSKALLIDALEEKLTGPEEAETVAPPVEPTDPSTEETDEVGWVEETE